MTERRNPGVKERGKQMPENTGVPDRFGHVEVGAVTGGTVIVGDHNNVQLVKITARPVKRQPISQLPRSIPDPLIGRERDVQILQTAVEAGQLVQVWGASGVGKSALLRHLARTLPRGPEGVAYIEAGGRTADDLAQAIFDVSFDALDNYKPSLEVLKEHLKSLKLRIYLDDAGLGENDLRRLFDMAEQSTFVFTSQQPTAVTGVHAFQLEGLTASAAARLVSRELGRDLGPDDTRIVKALGGAVRGNPLELRRIAMSAANGKPLPSMSALPGLLPALVKQLRPEEHDLLYLLGSLSGAELAERHLNDLLGRSDAAALAGGLVRHGLLFASETGYGCPPDVAACVLTVRATEFPAEQLCRTLTAWVEDQATTPDDVAAHFQALDVAVLRAERLGKADLGVSLARAASPKLALSRQFDAWGSLLGAGWTVAEHVGDKQGAEFFLREARTRRRAIGRAAQTTALVLEAEVLFRELAALQTHALAAPHFATTAAVLTPPPIHLTPPPPVHVTPPPLHLTPPVHVARPVFDLTKAAQQPPATAHATGAHAAAVHVPKQINLSGAHASAAHAPHAVSTATATTATGTGHTAVGVIGTTTAKGGISALALTCTIGFAAVVGIGAVAYANSQSSPSVDPACTAVASTWPSEIDQYNSDYTSANSALDSYNSAIDAYNSGQASTPPDDSMLLSDVQSEINDLQTIASTVQQAQGQAQSSSVQSDLDGILTPDQQMIQLYQAYESDPQSNSFDGSSQASAFNSAVQSLASDCGG